MQFPGGSYLVKRLDNFSWSSFLPQRLFAISANCVLIGGPVLSSSWKVAVNSFKISSWSSAPSCGLSFLCVLPPFTPSSKFWTSPSEAVTLIASESLRDFVQGPSASSSEEKLSLRCHLRPGPSVPIGSCETVSGASREQSPVGMRWHNCPKKSGHPVHVGVELVYGLLEFIRGAR